jgi:hypothetical protein
MLVGLKLETRLKKTYKELVVMYIQTREKKMELINVIRTKRRDSMEDRKGGENE